MKRFTTPALALLMALIATAPTGISHAQYHSMGELQEAAKRGDAEAQYDLGFAYYNGRRAIKDHAEAVKWFRKAAEQSDAQAQYHLGFAYYWGHGVDKNDAEAVKWWRKAAEQEDAKAQGSLGVAYAYGQGVIKDVALAHMWFNLAASQGHEEAAERRNYLEREMTPPQREEAEPLAREWVAKHREKE